MATGTIGMHIFSKSVRHFDSSVMVLSLNSTITHTENSYGICLDSSICLNIISATVPIDQLTNLY